MFNQDLISTKNGDHCIRIQMGKVASTGQQKIKISTQQKIGDCGILVDISKDSTENSATIKYKLSGQQEGGIIQGHASARCGYHNAPRGTNQDLNSSKSKWIMP